MNSTNNKNHNKSLTHNNNKAKHHNKQTITTRAYQQNITNISNVMCNKD